MPDTPDPTPELPEPGVGDTDGLPPLPCDML